MKKGILCIVFSTFLLIANNGFGNEKKFHADIVTHDGVSLGGNIDVSINSNGQWRIITHVHNSGLPKYHYQLIVKIVTPNGIVYAFQHGGSAEGTENSDITHGPHRDDDWDKSGFANIVQTNWNTISIGSMQWQIFYQDDITAVFTDLANTVSGGSKLLVSLAGDEIKKTVNGIEHVFNQTVDGISGLTKCIGNDIQGIGDATGFFINEAGQYIYYSAMGIIQLAFNKGDFPRMRTIHQDEYDWANAMIFNYSLPRIDRIKIFNFTNTDNHRFFTWPGINDYIYMNIGSAFDTPINYVDNVNKAYLAPGEVFIHELTHVWQIGKYGITGMVQKYIAFGGLNQTYEIKCPPSNINASYNLEQQASLVDAAYFNLYYPNAFDGPPKTSPNANCPYNIEWTEKNIRNNVKFDLNAINAVREMLKISNLTGGVNNNQAFHSNGNKNDGDGYYMVGKNKNSFLYYSNKTKAASANWGVIRDKFTQDGYEFGELGWPEISETLLPDGKGYFQRFNHGYIYWSSAHGAYVVKEKIFSAWAAIGWERGKLGYPVSDYIAESTPAPVQPNITHTNTGYQKFEGGVIFYTQTIGGVAGIQESASVEYGNPSNILAKREEMRYGPHVNNDVNLIGQQNNSNINIKNSDLNKKAINPQPLPPKNNNLQLNKSSINPQPLPPKINK